LRRKRFLNHGTECPTADLGVELVDHALSGGGSAAWWRTESSANRTDGSRQGQVVEVDTNIPGDLGKRTVA
jgi:hypothetical protein